MKPTKFPSGQQLIKYIEPLDNEFIIKHFTKLTKHEDQELRTLEKCEKEAAAAQETAPKGSLEHPQGHQKRKLGDFPMTGSLVFQGSMNIQCVIV